MELPRPFNPAFRENVRKNLLERKDELADPWCIGIFVDNELNWGNPDSLRSGHFFLPPTAMLKKSSQAILKNKYDTVENLNALGLEFLDHGTIC